VTVTGGGSTGGVRSAIVESFESLDLGAGEAFCTCEDRMASLSVAVRDGTSTYETDLERIPENAKRTAPTTAKADARIRGFGFMSGHRVAADGPLSRTAANLYPIRVRHN
jgi:hypothetical protein